MAVVGTLLQNSQLDKNGIDAVSYFGRNHWQQTRTNWFLIPRFRGKWGAKWFQMGAEAAKAAPIGSLLMAAGQRSWLLPMSWQHNLVQICIPMLGYFYVWHLCFQQYIGPRFNTPTRRTLTKHHYIDIDSHLKLNHIEYYVGGSSNFLMLFTTSLIILLAVKWLKLAMISSLSRGTKMHWCRPQKRV